MLWVKSGSRCTTIRLFDDRFTTKDEVSFQWMQSYDVDSSNPKWTSVAAPSTKATFIVQKDGELTINLLFGHPLKGEPASCRKNFCQILIRPLDEKRAVLPALAFVIKSEARGLKGDARIILKNCWHELVYLEALECFDRFKSKELQEFISAEQVLKCLRFTWERVFQHTVGTPAEVQPLSESTLQRLIFIGSDVQTLEAVPLLFCRQNFCGQSEKKGISIWRVFQNLIELVGRSHFIRRLVNSNQLPLLGPDELAEIDTRALLSRKQDIVYFFRIPRTLLEEPALVLEAFSVVRQREGAPCRLEALNPKPYITASLLSVAKGNPLIAFSRLESAHSIALKTLSPLGFLQFPTLRIKGESSSPSPISISEKIESMTNPSEEWWSSFYT